MNSGLLKIKSIGEIEGKFYVPGYQRGYRWGKQEVYHLLNDILESNGATYYLQPLVVKADPDDSWELVDGQQRLTTIYLICRYLKGIVKSTAVLEEFPELKSIAAMDKFPKFSLTYKTRADSGEYLDSLDPAESGKNIDCFHIFNAYKSIEEWFEDPEDPKDATRLCKYLLDGVKVLWYEAPSEVDSIDLFIRLNVGRIPLTDAELVKAQLLSHKRYGGGDTNRAPQIAYQWDLIERDLRVPELWSFLTGQSSGEATHISLLLDALADEPSGSEQLLFRTFEKLQPEIDKDPDYFWRRVVSIYSLVFGWYHDRDLYHKIGYLIAVGYRIADNEKLSLRSLCELAKDKGRKKFEEDLDGKIRSHIDLTSSELKELTYPRPEANLSERKRAKPNDVLLLMNVETIRKFENSSERYSFSEHAEGIWTLEHIHAQSAKQLTETDQMKAWLKEHQKVLANLLREAKDQEAKDQEVKELLGSIDDALKNGVLELPEFDQLSDKVIKILSSDSDGYDPHSISNLALLLRDDNAVLNNSVFEVKRRKIIELDEKGSFIPVCTRNVFLKYYTSEGIQQLHFWSADDRKAYLDKIVSTVKPYLKEVSTVETDTDEASTGNPDPNKDKVNK